VKMTWPVVEGTVRVEGETAETTEAAISADAVDDKVIARVASLAATEFPPLATFLSGIVSQELVKLTGKYSPLRQYLYYDVFEVLPEDQDKLSPGEFAPAASRYDDLLGIFGRTLQDRVMNQRVFLVGCGALGCELLKNFAVAGIACGPSGYLTATDMDHIEISNLSRQFLYRRRHVGSAKSSTSVAEVQRMNPSLKARAMEIAVGGATEGTFNEDFWESQDIVVNALDNVEARKYVDRRCVFFAKPLLESGTLGTKANTQVVVPFKTETYGDNNDGADDGDAIPMCTLREFPYLSDHCIEWARSLFEGEFSEAVRGAIALIADPATWLAQQREGLDKNPQPEALRQVLTTLQRAEKSTFESCVEYARQLFEAQFTARIKTMTHACPADFVKDGAKYWSGHRRFPIAAAFSMEEPTAAAFIKHATPLFASTLGVALPAGWDAPASLAAAAAAAKVPEWKPTKVVLGDDKAGKGMSEFEDETVASLQFLKDIEAYVAAAGGAEGLRSRVKLTAVEFEKDDDTNHHIDFITAAANLRARNFAIPESSRIHVRVTAGKIIPAIATTTTTVTGLVSIEFYKLVAGKAVDFIRNCFFNTSVNQYAFGEPAGPKRTRSVKVNPAKGITEPIRAEPEGFTAWDVIAMPDGATVTCNQVVERLAASHKVTVTKILADHAGVGKDLFIARVAKHKTERGDASVLSVWESLFKTKAAGRYLTVIVAAKDDASEVVVPPLLLPFQAGMPDPRTASAW